MNPAQLAHAVAEIDSQLLETLLRLQGLMDQVTPSNPAFPALKHALETIACLSAGMEQLTSTILQEGPENPSWN